MSQQTAPPGAPTTQTTFSGMIVGCLVFVRRFAALKQWGWVGACVATAVAVLVLTWWPDMDGISVRLVIASAILFGFVAALAAHLIRGLPDSTH